MWIKVWVVKQEYARLNLRINFKNYINFVKFKYLKFIKSRVKN